MNFAGKLPDPETLATLGPKVLLALPELPASMAYQAIMRMENVSKDMDFMANTIHNALVKDLEKNGTPNPELVVLATNIHTRRGRLAQVMHSSAIRLIETSRKLGGYVPKVAESKLTEA